MTGPKIIVVMGSRSDMKVMSGATNLLQEWGVSVQTEILSAHRTPDLLEKRAKMWSESGVKIIIAGAGGAAHLPGMLASFSILPVIGVPVASKAINGLDSLLSIAQMPKGVPVATVGVDNAINAALFALEILALEVSPFGRKVSQNIRKFRKGAALQIRNDRKKLSNMTVAKFLKMTKK